MRVKKIVLETKDGEEVELTVEQALGLYYELDGMFGKPEKYVPYNPYWQPIYPTEPYKITWN